jgi:hypothetical protein
MIGASARTPGFRARGREVARGRRTQGARAGSVGSPSRSDYGMWGAQKDVVASGFVARTMLPKAPALRQS